MARRRPDLHARAPPTWTTQPPPSCRCPPRRGRDFSSTSAVLGAEESAFAVSEHLVFGYHNSNHEGARSAPDIATSLIHPAPLTPLAPTIQSARPLGRSNSRSRARAPSLPCRGCGGRDHQGLGHRREHARTHPAAAGNRDPDVCLLASQYSLIDHANALNNVFPGACAKALSSWSVRR